MKQDLPVFPALHGSTSSGKQWCVLAGEITGQATVLAPNLPGYGSAAADKSDRLEMLAKVLAAQKGRVHIVAHSFGGAVAMKLANTCPERVSSVTLYDPITPSRDGADCLSPELDALWHEARHLAPRDLMRAFIEFWSGQGSWARLGPDQQNRLLAHHPGMIRDMTEVFSGRWTLDQVRYTGPLTILRGGLSPDVTATMCRAFARTHPQAVELLLPNHGHMAPLTHAVPMAKAFADCLSPYLKDSALAA